MEAELIHPDGERLVPAWELWDELRELVGAPAELDALGEPEATRQLATGRERGLDAVCEELVERTVSSP
jgi:hypothetical protein